MFCVNCGTQLLEGQNFCRNCGAAVKRPAAATPVATPSSVAPPPPPVAQATPVVRPSTPPPMQPGPQQAGRANKCAWCGAVVEAGQASCPSCGAAMGVAEEESESGWVQLPARKDMAKLKLGNSSCQIEGVYVPVADMNLAAGDSVYFAHHVLLWKDPQVNISTMSLKGAWKRMFAGLPLIMTQATGPGHVAFSMDDPGEVIPVPLHPGQEIDVREHILLTATSNVAYDWFQTNIWFRTKNGDDTETHYPMGMYMDRFRAEQTPGLVLLHAGGNVFVRDLKAGQTMLVKPSALVFKSPTVQMQLHFEHPGLAFSMWGSWGNRYLWLRVHGPGRIGVQSVFKPVEGEQANVVQWSNATVTRW